MCLPTISSFDSILQREFVQSGELLITLISLYGIIFYLLMAGENKKYFQKQK